MENCVHELFFAELSLQHWFEMSIKSIKSHVEVWIMSRFLSMVATLFSGTAKDKVNIYSWLLSPIKAAFLFSLPSLCIFMKYGRKIPGREFHITNARGLLKNSQVQCRPVWYEGQRPSHHLQSPPPTALTPPLSGLRRSKRNPTWI